MNIIGISGKIGTGKSTFADYLIEELGKTKWKKRGFAMALKEETHQLFGIPINPTPKEKDKKINSVTEKLIYKIGHIPPKYKFKIPPTDKCTVRDILQWWGTDIRRTQDSEYWIKAMENYIKEIKNKKGLIIDDVRFPNEIDLIKKYNGTTIRINTYEGWKCDTEVANHASEIVLDNRTDWDYAFTPEYGQLQKFATDEVLLNLIKKEDTHLFKKISEIPKEKDIGKTFILTIEENKAVHEWDNTHICPGRITTTIGGRLVYSFIPTGLGMEIQVECNNCGEIFVVTKYKNW